MCRLHGISNCTCHCFYRADERLKADRRLLEAAHLKYAILKVMKRYPEMFKHCHLCVKQEDTLEKLTSNFYSAFTSRYADTVHNYYVDIFTLYH